MAEKKIFAAINEIEVQVDASHKVRQERLKELLKDYLKAREPLLERRFELVTGRSEPTDEELKGFTPQGAAAAAATVSSPADAKATAAGSTSHGKGGKGQVARGVPFFWLNALCNEEKLAELITARDRCALEYLEDIRYLNGPMGIVLEFHFAPNPYFNNKVLRKGALIVMRKTEGGPDGESPPGPGPLGVRAMEELVRGVEGWRDESTFIDWKPGRSLLVRSEPPDETNKETATAAAAASEGKRLKKGRAGHATASASGGAGGGGHNKNKAGEKKIKGHGKAGMPSRSKRHQGKHTGPAPDLPVPDPDDAEEEVEDDEGKKEAEECAVHEGGSSGSRRRPCPSFFRFFLPLFDVNMRNRKELDPTADEDEDSSEGEEVEEEEEEGANSDTGQLAFGGRAATMSAAAPVSAPQRHQLLDAEVMDIIVKKVIPRAVHLYLSGNVILGKSSPRAHSPADDDADFEEEGFQLVSGSPAGEVASLALGAQKALHVLMAQQRQLDDLASELKRGEWESWVSYQQEVTRLLARRRTLLLGPAAAPANKMSIPAFWLRALRGVPYGSLLIQHRDERALSYLADVRLVWDTSRMPTPEDPHRKLDLELEFLTNPYFSNRVLRKSFTFYAPGGSLNRLWVQAAKSDPIEWQPGRDLTVKVPSAAAAEGAGRGNGRNARPRKVPSFFAFFDDSPGALVRAFAIPGGQSAVTIQEANQAQEEFMAELINFVVHFAGSIAAETTVDLDYLGDEREDEEDEEDEDDEDDDNYDDETADGEASQARRAKKAAARAARKRGDAAASDAGGGSGSGSSLFRRLFSGSRTGSLVIAVLAAIMLVAQALVFLDTLDHVRSRFKWAP